MNFAHFFYQQMPSLLHQYRVLTKIRERQPGDCKHHHIPANRACELWFPDSDIFRNKYFWYAWYFVDILDQNIHSNFPQNYPQYIQNIGSHYPIPMKGDAGFGCWRRVPPAFILSKVLFDGEEWTNACQFFIQECENRLPGIAHIESAEFFGALLQDKEFNSPGIYGLPHVSLRHEERFAELISARYFSESIRAFAHE
ncbi:hypothetical protein [Telluribacter sp.]|jgi:hypothetical protein|uniref:hypothetical protein n=1 Tax=Telluribacter sp. TaxID=1978767 RepID=UPI002E126053|nr:hypothetical protein [Telluribacter sp.]